VASLAAIAAAVCLAAVSCGSAGPPAGPAAGSLQVRACTVAGWSARCGTLIVPEDRLTGKGRTIPVRFVVMPALTRPSAPDPVVWFAGGPGGSAVGEISSELPMLQSLNVHRDLVFIDQRGTGGSNPLTCPVFRGSLAGKAALRASVVSCLARLPADLRFYTTAMFVDDVNEVLTRLHYAKVDLIGGSYGATAAQVFLLRHPGRVRTMTLLGGTPLNVPLFERFPGNAQRALGYVFARCESQPSCHQAFPHLAADWAVLWASLGRSPWVVPAGRSATGKPLRLDQDGLATVLHQLLVTGDLDPIPVTVHTLAVAKDKVAALASVVNAFRVSGQGQQSSGPNLMMPDEIQCQETWASWRPRALSDQRASFEYHADLQTALLWQYICPFFPKSPAVGGQQLTVSQVPVLAFNGEADPQDPPQNMAAARTFWPDSSELAVPGEGHGTDPGTWAACLGTLTQTFIEQDSPAHLDTSCLAKVPATHFDLTLHQVALGNI